MATEELTLVVNDTELEVALMRLNLATTARKRVLQQAGGITGIRDIRSLARQIPTITRAQRLVITQIPMTREALTLIYRLKMLAGAGAPLTAAVIGIYLAKWYERWQADLERERGNYETMIRKGQDLTHMEYLALEAAQVGYATAFDEFKAKWDAGEYLDAIADYVIAQLPSRLPTYLGRIPYDPTTLPPEVEEHWLKKLDDILTDWWKNLWKNTGKSNEDTDYEYNMNVMGGDVH